MLDKENKNENKEEIKENKKQKYVDPQLEYSGMYNWTNDLPENTRKNYLDIIEYFNTKKIKNPKILEIGNLYWSFSYKFIEFYKKFKCNSNR